MANHKSAIKRNRQNIKRRDRNRAARSAVRTSIKGAISAAGTAEGKTLLIAAESSIASAAKKGLLHRRTAQRKISRMVKAANASLKTAKKA